MTIFRGSASALGARRRLRVAIQDPIRTLVGDPCIAEHLVSIIWELLMNLEHASLDDNAEVLIRLEGPPPRIVVLLPGACFNSVARAKQAGARGMDTAAVRLVRCSWQWSHRYVDGRNEISLGAKEEK